MRTGWLDVADATVYAEHRYALPIDRDLVKSQKGPGGDVVAPVDDPGNRGRVEAAISRLGDHHVVPRPAIPDGMVDEAAEARTEHELPRRLRGSRRAPASSVTRDGTDDPSSPGSSAKWAPSSAGSGAPTRPAVSTISEGRAGFRPSGADDDARHAENAAIAMRASASTLAAPTTIVRSTLMPVSGAISRSCPNGQRRDSATGDRSRQHDADADGEPGVEPDDQRPLAMGQTEGPEAELSPRPSVHEP